ncbi:tripartite tricarboxylate transporter TctB family protein [Arvimicrobium flavum]|uniref:tripartite tricarboxylate transporter TctB family protein n=1 Tax=Arvimicrobium flavum TaxID=3393320 RepID=UPI00237B1CD3|nr:tripartite tricarboxylate transporter TctB family protein [Mesorhizobium shangrilense]
MLDPETRNAAARRNPVWLILAFAGSVAFWLALDFGIGTAANIGSGIFPLAFAAIIVVISLRSYAVPVEEEAEPWALRPLVAVAGAVLLFILLVEQVGLFPTIVVSMLVAYAGQVERNYWAFLLFAAAFAAAVWLIFVYALSVPLQFIGTS